MGRFRAFPQRGGSPRVDRDAGIIHGVSAIQTGEALGHDMLIDHIMIDQVLECGEAAELGIKSRYTHPGLCSDGMGKMLGRLHNWRRQGDKAIADLHLHDSAATSPDGDLRTYILDLAEEDPKAFALSIVFENDAIWKLPDGSEISVRDPSLRRSDPYGYYYVRPDDATTDMPFARCLSLYYADAVDEPAANRDGLFTSAAAATALSRGSAEAQAAFDQLDLLRHSLGLSIDQTHEFAMRYLTSRGLTRRKNPMHKKSKKPARGKRQPTNSFGAALAGLLALAIDTEIEARLANAPEDEQAPNEADILGGIEKELAASGGISIDEVDDILTGVTSELSEKARKGFVEVLGVTTEQIDAAIAEDVGGDVGGGGESMSKADFSRLAAAYPDAIADLVKYDAEGLSGAEAEQRLSSARVKALETNIAALSEELSKRDETIEALRKSLERVAEFRQDGEGTPDPGADHGNTGKTIRRSELRGAKPAQWAEIAKGNITIIEDD